MSSIHGRAPAARVAEEPEQGGPHLPRLVGVIWALLIINTLGSAGTDTILPLPREAFQAITMGALAVAFALALLLNPRLRIRPSPYLFLVSLLLLVSVVSSAQMESGMGALIRSARLTLFIATLWLISPWLVASLRWVRYHIKAFAAVLLTVLLGLAAPGFAYPEEYDGRLAGAIWPLTPTEVAQLAAVVAGLTFMLWITRNIDGWSAGLFAAPALALLLQTHTRTAAVALLVAVVAGGFSLLLTSTRARRAFTSAALGVGVAAAAFGTGLQAWFERGQDDEALGNLTGRQLVWDRILAEPRSTQQELIGVGLTDKSFGGLAIDSTWLAVYYEQGLVGVTIVALIFLALIVAALTRPPSRERACAIFLIAFCAVYTYTEVGIGDASPHMLHLALATALLTRADEDVPQEAGEEVRG